MPQEEHAQPKQTTAPGKNSVFWRLTFMSILCEQWKISITWVKRCLNVVVAVVIVTIVVTITIVIVIVIVIVNIVVNSNCVNIVVVSVIFIIFVLSFAVLNDSSDWIWNEVLLLVLEHSNVASDCLMTCTIFLLKSGLPSWIWKEFRKAFYFIRSSIFVSFLCQSWPWPGAVEWWALLAEADIIFSG